MSRFLLGGFLGLALATSGFAQGLEAPGPNISSRGMDILRGLLQHHKIKPLTEAEYRRTDRSEVIAIVIGNQSPRGFEPGICSAVLRASGSVLIATKQPLDLGASGYLPSRFQPIQISGSPVRCNDADSCFEGHLACPFVVPVGRVPTRPDAAHLLLLGLSRVATNTPSHVTTSFLSDMADVGQFPPGSRAADQRPQDRNSGVKLIVASTGKEDRPHRLMVVADTGIFSNQMMVGTADTPTDNLAFANAVTQWLSVNGTRQKCIFIEDGEIVTSFDRVSLDAVTPTPPLPPLPPLSIDFDPLNPKVQEGVTKGINDAITKLEANDVFNRSILGGFVDDYGKWMRRAFVTIAGLLMLWLGRRVWKQRHEPELVPIPKDTGRAASSGKPGSLARRREELLQTGNYTAVVRDYVQSLFQVQGLDPNLATVGQKLPPVTITGPDAKTLTAQLRKLWDVAYGAKPRPIIYSRWKELEPMIQAVQQAAREGRWRFDSSRQSGSSKV